jgi:hypothetical protein
MIYITPEMLTILKRNMRLSPSTAHKIMRPFCAKCLITRVRFNTIVKTKAGYVVMSQSKGADGKRKRLSKPYKSRGEAVRRLAIIDYLKVHKS